VQVAFSEEKEWEIWSFGLLVVLKVAFSEEKENEKKNSSIMRIIKIT
jgi:hypothetical protein